MREQHAGLTPIPATHEALDELEAAHDQDAVLQRLLDGGARVRELVPDCVGVSLARIEHGVTLTLVASAEEVGVLDGVQYLAGGPCVEAAHAERVVAVDHEEMLDEDAWQLFASATAARGIRSTLTLPILVAGAVAGSVNLYAASPDAFDGHHQEIAEIFSGWAPGAVTNADLGFATRQEAQQAPQQLRDEATVQTAVGILAGAEGVEAEEAEQRLHQAATRAAVEVLELARTVIEAAGRRGNTSL